MDAERGSDHRGGGVPVPGAGEVLVEVYASGLNPFAAVADADGHDFAGRIAAVGPGELRLRVGDDVLGWVSEGPHAASLTVPTDQLVRKPAGLAWEVAGALSVVGTAAWEAAERPRLDADDTVVVTDAAGATGCLLAQLARAHGARVLGIADAARADFLRQFGVEAVAEGPGLADRLRTATPEGVTAFFDCYGDAGALAAEIGVASSRVVDVAALERRMMSRSPGAARDDGERAARNAERVALARLVAMFEAHRLRLPIADVYPFAEAADAYRASGEREAHGAVVLGMRTVDYPGQLVHGIDAREQAYTIDVPTEHPQMHVVEAVPAALGDGSVRRRRAGWSAHDAAEAAGRRRPHRGERGDG